MSALAGRTARVSEREAWLAGAVLALEGLAVVGYHLSAAGDVTAPRYAVYPFVWLNVGALGVWAATPPRASPRRGALAAGVAAAYFGVLALLTGLVAVYPPGAATVPLGWQVTLGPPGWGPRVAYVAETFHVYLVPYQVLGFAALAYLVYAAVLDALTRALGAVVGVGACVGCTLPLVAPGVVGGAAGAGAALSGVSVDLSTAAYCVAVGLLSLR